MPDAVDTVVCAPDDGWCYHPKYVEQFLDIINCVTSHLVGYIYIYIYIYIYWNIEESNSGKYYGISLMKSIFYNT
jgi:hypothetical protein